MSHTIIGLPPTRLPSGHGRDRLLRLAQIGAEICHQWRYRTLALICDSLAMALNELAIAECRLVACAERIEELETLVRKLEFNAEPTRSHEPSSRSLARLKPTAAMAVPGAR